MKPKFIVDLNVGKLTKWLRIMGYDTLLVNEIDDDQLIRIAIKEGRILLTKDTGILRRGVVFTERLKVVLIRDDEVHKQLRQVTEELDLKRDLSPFSLCLECNQPLVPKEKKEVKGLVPPYVFQTKDQYMECPICHRIYWRGTHWQHMNRELQKIIGN